MKNFFKKGTKEIKDTVNNLNPNDIKEQLKEDFNVSLFSSY